MLMAESLRAELTAARGELDSYKSQAAQLRRVALARFTDCRTHAFKDLVRLRDVGRMLWRSGGISSPLSFLLHGPMHSSLLRGFGGGVYMFSGPLESSKDRGGPLPRPDTTCRRAENGELAKLCSQKELQVSSLEAKLATREAELTHQRDADVAALREQLRSQEAALREEMRRQEDSLKSRWAEESDSLKLQLAEERRKAAMSADELESRLEQDGRRARRELADLNEELARVRDQRDRDLRKHQQAR